MSKSDHEQTYRMISVLLLTASKGEHVLQSIRQVISSNLYFTPLSLFRYISNNGAIIKAQHLIKFLQQNSYSAYEYQIKNIIESTSNKRYWDYKDFLAYVYPFNTAILRQVTTNQIKNYSKLDKYQVHKSILAGFLILLTQTLQIQRKLEIQKQDSLNKISKQKLRKVLLSIKKASTGQLNHCLNDNTRITHLQLRIFLKAFVSVQDVYFLFLSRKLGIKKGWLLIDDFQKFLRPIKKNKMKSSSQKKNIINKPEVINIEDFQQQQQKQFNDKQYRNDLYHQLASSLKLKDQNIKQYIQKTPKKQNHLQEMKAKQNKKQENLLFSNKYICYADEGQKTNLSAKDLLKKYVTQFLPVNRQIQELKEKLSHYRIDLLQQYKNIDSKGRGIIYASDLLNYYRSIGGRLSFTSQDFQLIIQRYTTQQNQSWISFTQFCQMLRNQQKPTNKFIPRFGQQHEAIIVKILQINIQNQLKLLNIRKQFRKNQAKILFNLINRQNTGFFNYQQLKKYFHENGLKLSMYDLMAILKRFDKYKNGVVVEHEFISYFQPSQ